MFEKQFNITNTLGNGNSLQNSLSTAQNIFISKNSKRKVFIPEGL